jgi:hypothetical protein
MEYPKLKICWFQYETQSEKYSDSEYEIYFSDDECIENLHILKQIRKQICKYPHECNERRDAILTYASFSWKKLFDFSKKLRKKIYEELSEYIKPYLDDNTYVNVNCDGDEPCIVKVCDEAKRNYEDFIDMYNYSLKSKSFD